MDRRDAVDDVMEHTSSSVSYHKIVLSPGEDEPVQDWQEWTREVMVDLEEQQGKDLHWYAVHHSNTEHEHVHVVLAGAAYLLFAAYPFVLPLLIHHPRGWLRMLVTDIITTKTATSEVYPYVVLGVGGAMYLLMVLDLKLRPSTVYGSAHFAT